MYSEHFTFLLPSPYCAFLDQRYVFFFSCCGTSINQQYTGIQKRINIWSYVYRNWQKRISPFLDSPFRSYSIQRGEISGKDWQSYFGPRALKKLNRNPHPNNGNFEGSKKVRVQFILECIQLACFLWQTQIKTTEYSLNDTIRIKMKGVILTIGLFIPLNMNFQTILMP